MSMKKRGISLLLAAILLVISAGWTVTASAADADFKFEKGVILKYLGSDPDVVIPETIKVNGKKVAVKSIGAGAFMGSDIETVTIKNNVTFIGASAFEDCEQLTTVTLKTDKLTTISANAFKTCPALTAITIPRGVTTIGSGAFMNCIKLKKVMGPQEVDGGYFPVSADVTTVGAQAFENCPHAVIHCFKGSAVETHAMSNSLQYKSLDPIVEEITPGDGKYKHVLFYTKDNPGSVMLSASVKPTIAAGNTLGWSTSDKAVATVNEAGFVTATGVGHCYITIDGQTHFVGKQEAKCAIEIVVLSGTGSRWQKIEYKKPGESKKTTEYYYRMTDGTFATGWQTINKKQFWFNPGNAKAEGLGVMAVGWAKVEGKWYFFYNKGKEGTRGYLVESTSTRSGSWEYESATKKWKYKSNGKYVKKKWVSDNGKWYYIKADGYMATGWVTVGGKKYYLDPKNGDMKIGWYQIGSAYYYFNGKGAMEKNSWVQSENGWYYMGSDGKMVKNQIKSIKGAKYYFNSKGAMVTGWAKVSGSWYYFKADGRMTKKSWLQDGGQWYYLGSDGKMLTGTHTIDGKKYTFSSKGVLIK